MTPADLARLHAEAFTVPRPWSEAEFAGLLATPGAFLCTEDDGFVLGRVVADEAELLTIAVPAASRRKGIGRALLEMFAAKSASAGAREAFLEVAADNTAAIALYRQGGWQDAGCRKGYYTAPDRKPVDALVLRRSLP